MRRVSSSTFRLSAARGTPWNTRNWDESVASHAVCARSRDYALQMKLQIMSDWIRDLGEQNMMLVHTVEDLEQAACNRVKLLEEKLKQSSQMVVDNLARSNHSEKVRRSRLGHSQLATLLPKHKLYVPPLRDRLWTVFLIAWTGWRRTRNICSRR